MLSVGLGDFSELPTSLDQRRANSWGTYILKTNQKRAADVFRYGPELDGKECEEKNSSTGSVISVLGAGEEK